jgi:hypothetical protein
MDKFLYVVGKRIWPNRNNKFVDLRANCSTPSLINSAGI